MAADSAPAHSSNASEPLVRRCRAAIVAAVSCVALASGCSRSRADVSDDGHVRATVVRVVDGDTVILSIGGERETVRLVGVNTPETVKPDTPVECYGPEASAFTKSYLPRGSSVYVKRDVEARDKYGRLLLYVWRSNDDEFVNRELLALGYARVMSIEPNTAFAPDFARAASDARTAGLGLWSACSG